MLGVADNPYLSYTLGRLAEACMKAAVALESTRARSGAGWKRLDERLRLLLIATGHRLNPDFFRSHTHDDGSFDSLRDAALAWVEHRARETRYLVISHAAERVLGGRGKAWVTHGQVGDPPVLVHELALRDDAGLRASLDELAALASRKR